MTIPRILLLLLLTCLSPRVSSQVPYRDASLPVETRVSDLLGRMTPEEKFWQLFMIAESWDLSKERYSKGIFGFEGGASEGSAAGQMINPDQAGSAVQLVGRINEAQRLMVGNTRLGIPMIPFAEALHGLVREGATSFPQSIALAATFDSSLMRRVARAIAGETRACGIRMVLSPVVNIADDPRWGRTEETYGEDPWLSSAMGVAFVSEFEKAGIISCPKHFVANSGAGGRDSYPVHLTERFLEEVCFPPFKACISQGGSRSVMAAYNSLDGIPCTANSWLLEKKLKQEWKFSGFVISDAGATGGTNCLHMTAKDYHESTVLAMNNGLDVIFQTDFEHYKLFQPPFLDGSVKKEAIDQAVARVLRAKFELGLFERPFSDTLSASGAFGKKEHLSLALEAARKSIVLLKNEDNILPFRIDGMDQKQETGTGDDNLRVKTLAVIGTDAVEARLGGYSGPGFNKINMLDAIRGLFADPAMVSYAPWCGRSGKTLMTVPGEWLSHLRDGRKTPGLNALYFNNVSLAGEPVLARTDQAVDFRWTLYSPDPSVNYDWFSAQWTGQVTFPTSEPVKIGIEGNDGYRLFIDGQKVVDRWEKGSYGATMGNFHPAAGVAYPIRLEFRETSGSVRLRLVVESDAFAEAGRRIEEAIQLAGRCDATVIVAGIEEGEGLDRAMLSLPGRQEELIMRTAELGKPLVVVLVGGSAVTMERWIGRVRGIIHCWYPGEQGGKAVADILFGRWNPSGRLPITFPVTEGQLPLTYNHKPTGRNDDYGDLTGEARFPFGHGLSYTQFEYLDPVLDKPAIRKGDTAMVSLTIRNTGKTDGEEVVQLYIRDLYASVARPLKELRGCRRIFIPAGESRDVSFAILPEMVTMLDENLKEVIEPGEFRILIGASSKDIRARLTLEVLP